MFSSYCRYKNNPTNINVAESHDDAPMIRTQFGPPLPSFHSLQSSGGMIFNGVTVGAPSSSPICTWRQRHVFLPGVFPISCLIDSAFAGPTTVGRHQVAVVPLGSVCLKRVNLEKFYYVNSIY